MKIYDKKLAYPYFVWMVLFTVVPLFIVVYYAMTDAEGNFTLNNLTSISGYGSVFARSLLLARHRLPGGVFPVPVAGEQAAHHAYAGHAAHVDELFAAYLRMDGSAQRQWHTTMVEEPPTSWADLWDVEYAGNVLMFNNSRDAYAIAAKKMGLFR